MNTKFMSVMLVGMFGFAVTTDVSASDLSRFLEHSRINVSVGGGYSPYYAPVYAPQYPVPYPVYPQFPPMGYAPAPPMYVPQPVYYAPVSQPIATPVIGVSFGGHDCRHRPYYGEHGSEHHGEEHQHIYHGGGWNRD